MCEQTTQEPTLKGSEGIIPKAHIGWKWLLLFPLIRVENLIINRTLDRVFRRVFITVGGKIRVKAALLLPKKSLKARHEKGKPFLSDLTVSHNKAQEHKNIQHPTR